MLAPKSHVDKVYYVGLAHPLSEEARKQLEAGVEIEKDTITKPAKCEITEKNECFEGSCAALLTITEGKFHQVKRMFEAVGNEVVYLKRLSFGPLTLDPDLPEGHYRKCTEEEIKNMRDVIHSKYDKIEILINNAAYASDNYLVDKSKEEFMKVLEVNVVGTFLVTKYLYPYLDGGIIVNISSTDAVDTYSRISMDYCASKAGVNSLTKTFAQEFENIKVIGFMPAWTNTESVKEMNSEYLENELKRIKQNKLYEPKEVAENIIKIINDKRVESGEIFYECRYNDKKC